MVNRIGISLKGDLQKVIGWMKVRG